MSDANAAKDLDGDVLGEDVGDEGLPGVGDYPPDQALGVNDPNLVAPDDMAMRAARHRVDDLAGDDAPVGDLLSPGEEGDEPLDGLVDDEHQAIATAGDDTDRADLPAEVAAIHERRVE